MFMSLETSMIQALPSDVIDQIAAGEVVERPAHLVKELVENSLDAGATEVTVEVSDGGRNVVVKDNGSGIPSADLAKALDRHTTSKITKTEDLWKLSTYGFRGEALASIAAVSDLVLSSRPAKEESGARIQSQFGRKTSVDRIGHSRGTRVQVSQLFENVPARLKFMKSAAGEIGAIRNVLKAMALARPDVQMQFFVEGRLDLHYPVCSSRRERAEQVLEISPLYEGQATRDGITAFSVMGDPSKTAKTSKNIWILAQNRWIQDRALQAAVMESYRTLLMHGEYPLVVTWVEAPPEQIDVNIHPTKSQVKFAEPSNAFRAVAASIRETLEKAPWVAQILRSESKAMPTAVSSATSPENLSFESGGFETTQYRVKPSFSELSSPATVFESGVRAALEKAAASREETKSVDLEGKWAGLQILGQANLTYLICQKREGLVIVDQHAAHERVLFEKIMKGWREGGIEVQEFLFPLSVDLSAEKKEALLQAVPELARLGVHLEEMGPQTVGVRAAPLWIKENILPKVLDQVATQVSEHGGSFAFESWVADLAATMACHSAIRAGQSLSTDEIRSLLSSMDDFPLSSFCPHGRPVSVEYPFVKMEKDFGRTVS
jgi:DNA mismatch repair protein MutL